MQQEEVPGEVQKKKEKKRENMSNSRKGDQKIFLGKL